MRALNKVFRAMILNKIAWSIMDGLDGNFLHKILIAVLLRVVPIFSDILPTPGMMRAGVRLSIRSKIMLNQSQIRSFLHQPPFNRLWWSFLSLLLHLLNDFSQLVIILWLLQLGLWTVVVGNDPFLVNLLWLNRSDHWVSWSVFCENYLRSWSLTTRFLLLLHYNILNCLFVG